MAMHQDNMDYFRAKSALRQIPRHGGCYAASLAYRCYSASWVGCTTLKGVSHRDFVCDTEDNHVGLISCSSAASYNSATP